MKKIIIGFFVLLGVLILGVAIFVLTFDINSYKSQIEGALRDATGYPFSIKGKISVSMSFEPTAVVENVEIKNRESFKAPFFFSAKKAQISFDLKSLFKDVIVVHSIALSDVNVNLEVAENGTPNWSPSRIKTDKSKGSKPSLTKAAAQEGAPKTASISSVSMKNMNVVYQNAMTGKNLELFFPNLSVEQLLNFTGEVVYKKENFSFSGTIKNLTAVLITQRNLNFSFDVKSSLISGKVSGICRDLTDFKNDMTLNLDTSGEDLQKVYAFFIKKNDKIISLPFAEQSAIRLVKSNLLLDGSFSFPDTGINLSYNIEQNLTDGSGKGVLDVAVPDKNIAHLYGVEPFSLKTSYALSADKVLELSNLTAMFDETDIDGSMKVDFSNPKPKIDLSLHSHYLKLSNIIYFSQDLDADKKQTNLDEKAEDKLFSNKQIDFSILNSFDASSKINIDYFGLSNIFLRHPQLYINADLKDGVLTLLLNEGSSLAGGKVVGKAILNTQDVMPSLDIDLVAQDLKLNQVYAWKEELKAGDVGINLFLNTKGKSIADLLANLNGTALFRASQVDILSPAIGRLFPENTSSISQKAAQELFIKCAVLNTTIKDGVIQLSQRAGMETGRFNMIVSGDVDLKNETLDLHFIPQRSNKKQETTLSSVIQGVSLKGKLTDPVSSIDVDVAKFFPEGMTQKISEKQAFLNSYTRKTLEDNSICKMALGTTTFKDIDAYFGRDLIVEEPEEPVQVVEEPHEISRAQKIGRDFLDSLSGVLSTENKKQDTSAKNTDNVSTSTAE